jgi:hypothetical protein
MKVIMTSLLPAILFGMVSAQVADAASARREPNGAIRFYDDNGNDQGYAWCRSRGGWGSMAPPDCSYYTLQQCQASAFGTYSSYCMRNPWAAQATQPKRRR